MASETIGAVSERIINELGNKVVKLHGILPRESLLFDKVLVDGKQAHVTAIFKFKK